MLLAGIFMLIASGLFDMVAPSINTVENRNLDDVHSGVNLNNLNKINDLEKAVASNPNDHQRLLELAHLLNDSRLYDKAVQYYTQYLKSHPDDTDVKVDMGVCYFELKKYDDAVAEMESALKINPDHQIAHFNLGIVNMSMGNMDKAKEWWRKSIQINPTNNIGQKAQELLNSN
jgi:tetratricopeptide (TPR) repeat protein